MKPGKLFCILAFTVISHTFISAQTTVIGIDGLTFNQTDSAYTIGITDSFKLHGMDITPDQLSLSWDPSTQKFSFYGSIALEVDGNDISISLGDQGSPGITILNSTISEVVLSVDGQFTMYGMNFNANSLTIEWSGSGTSYSFYGTASASFAASSVSVSFGSSEADGIIIDNGSISQFSVGISTVFDLYSVSFSPDDLTLYYNSSSDAYKIYGRLSASIEGQVIDLDAGDITTSGIELSGDELSSMNLGITSDFTIDGIEYKSDDLKFGYIQSSNSFSIYGSTTISLDSESIDITLGDESTPGIQFSNDKLTYLSASITADITMRGVIFKPSGLTFGFNESINEYIIYGSADIVVDSNELSASFGSDSNPGFVYSNNSIQKINLTLSGNSTLNGLIIKPDNVTFEYSSSQQAYILFGSGSVSVGSDKINVTMGSADSPGIQVMNGSLENLNFGITADFSLSGLQFTNSGLTFIYNKSANLYEIYGGADITVDQEVFDLQFGDSTNPGITIQNGLLESLTSTITADFSLSSLEFKPDNLTFDYNKTNDSYIIYGDDAVVEVGSDSIDVSMGSQGSPGIEIISGELKNLNLGITADFVLETLEFSPDGLTIIYNADNSYVSMSGGAKLSVEDEKLTVDFGDTANPGIKITNGVLTDLNLSVTGDFSFNSLDFSPDDLTFGYNKAASKYYMYGTVNVKIEDDNISAGFGSESSPGFEYVNGEVTNIDISVTGEFGLKDVTITPNSLTFIYQESSSAYIMYGTCKVKIEEDNITANLGSSDDPGIKISNGIVEHINIGITGRFGLKDISFTPDNLTFEWDKENDYFEMYGAALITIENEVFSLEFGDADKPGIVVKDNELQSLTSTLTGNFTMADMKFKPQNLTFDYNKSNDSYIIYGDDAVIAVGSDSIDVSMGTVSSPGIEVIGGSLQNLNLGVTADFTLETLEFAPEDLTIIYNADKDYVSMSGGAKLSVKSEKLSVDFGTTADPGIQITKGVLTDLNLSVTGDFSFNSLDFSPDDLTFGYNKAASKYYMFGTVNVKIEDDNISAGFGSESSPGFEYVNGEVTNIDISVSGEFGLKDVNITPDALTFIYHEASSSYIMYGSCKVKIESDEIAATLGSESDPGIKITNGEVEHINFGVTGEFGLKGLSFTPDALTFEWDKASDYFEMYGSATIDVEGDDVKIDLHDADNPGIVIKDNKLKSLDVSVSEDFEMKGLKIEVDDLTVVYNSSLFEFYGDIKLNIGGESIAANFGTSSDPGLKIDNGSLTHFNIGVTGNIKIGALDAAAKNLTCEYDKSSSKYYLSGEVKFDALFSLDINLGTDGIEIDVSGTKDKLIINGLTLELDNADLGTIDFKKIKISFDSDGIKEADLNVAFPLGWEVEADMKFTGDPAKLHEVSIDWQADNLEDAIEIPETGIAISEIKGTMDKIDDPSNMEFNGTVVLTFAGPESIDGKEVALFEMSSTVIIKKTELSFHTDVELGAYKSGSSWHGLLGSGSATIDLKWNHYYKFDASLKIPSDPLVEIDSKFTLHKSKDLEGLMDVEFIVPKWIPFVGGKKYGSVDGAIRYVFGKPHSSYAAGWVHYSIHIWFVHKSGDIGAKYNFGSRKVSKIGSGSIKND